MIEYEREQYIIDSYKLLFIREFIEQKRQEAKKKGKSLIGYRATKINDSEAIVTIGFTIR